LGSYVDVDKDALWFASEPSKAVRHRHGHILPSGYKTKLIVDVWLTHLMRTSDHSWEIDAFDEVSHGESFHNGRMIRSQIDEHMGYPCLEQAFEKGE
jgi:hypothetical protein